MKNIFILLALVVGLGTVKVSETELPTVPGDCFNDGVYCYGSKVFDLTSDQKAIRVHLFAHLDGAQYGTSEDIVNRFFAFENWGTYAADSNDITIINSKTLPSVVENGQTIRKHLAYYETKAPFPIFKMKVYEVAKYYQLATVPGAILSYKFVSDTKAPDTRGLKYKVGILHLAHDAAADQFTVYLTIDVIPAIDLLPGIAAPYIERAMMGIFLGMFGLN